MIACMCATAALCSAISSRLACALTPTLSGYEDIVTLHSEPRSFEERSLILHVSLIRPKPLTSAPSAHGVL